MSGSEPEMPANEVAVARALHRLADPLLTVASDDLQAVQGHRFDLSS